jgi:predicted flap endonuclease-1-like 5' DNA nuclease
VEEEDLKGMEFIQLYWPVILVGLIIGLIVGYLIFRPKQNVRLSDAVPTRPHMTHGNAAGEGRNIADEAAAAASDIAGHLLRTNVHDHLPGAAGPPDDLLRLKGVGPKLAGMLNERGITRFDQIARLSPGQVEMIDASLGAFRGRLERDRVLDQADYLARGDVDGYEATFGKLPG